MLSYTIAKKFQETDQDAYEALMLHENKKAAQEQREHLRQYKKKLSKKQVKYYVDSSEKFSGFRVSFLRIINSLDVYRQPKID